MFLSFLKNDGRTTCKKSPVALPRFGRGAGQTPAAALSCGNEFSVALAEDGGVWTFGYGGSGQLGTGNKENMYDPRRVSLPGAAQPTDVVCGMEYTMVLARESVPVRVHAHFVLT